MAVPRPVRICAPRKLMPVLTGSLAAFTTFKIMCRFGFAVVGGAGRKGDASFRAVSRHHG